MPPVPTTLAKIVAAEAPLSLPLAAVSPPLAGAGTGAFGFFGFFLRIEISFVLLSCRMKILRTDFQSPGAKDVLDLVELSLLFVVVL